MRWFVRLRVKIIGKKKDRIWNNSLTIKHKCWLVVKLKANKNYLELLCYLSFYIHLLSIITSWLFQTHTQFQVFSAWSRLLTSSKLLMVIVVIHVISQSFDQLFISWLNAIRPLLGNIFLIKSMLKWYYSCWVVHV